MRSLNEPTERRGFLRRLTALTAAMSVPAWRTASAESDAAVPSPEDWVDRIKGKHRQVFDATTHNSGFAAAYAANFMDGYKQTMNASDADITAVIVYRHMAMPLMLRDELWQRYKIGEFLKVDDPESKSVATRNVFQQAVLLHPGLNYERLADRGAVFVACNLALTVFSQNLAVNAGVSAEQAKKEWTEGLLKGVSLAPSGVYAVSRAQEKGCSYCYAG